MEVHADRAGPSFARSGRIASTTSRRPSAGDDVAGLLPRAGRHRGLECGLVGRMGVEVGEERGAVHVLERRPARANRLEQAFAPW